MVNQAVHARIDFRRLCLNFRTASLSYLVHLLAVPTEDALVGETLVANAAFEVLHVRMCGSEMQSHGRLGHEGEGTALVLTPNYNLTMHNIYVVLQLLRPLAYPATLAGVCLWMLFLSVLHHCQEAVKDLVALGALVLLLLLSLASPGVLRDDVLLQILAVLEGLATVRALAWLDLRTSRVLVDQLPMSLELGLLPKA